MPKPQHRGRSRRSGLFVVGISALVLLAAAATLVAIVGWKTVRNVFAKNDEDVNKGKVAVVVSPTPMPAFTQVDPAVFVDPQTGNLHVVWVSEKVAQDANWIRNPAAMRGRVLKHDKGAGLAFSDADFYPKGTLPSASAAVEPGYRGVTLSTQKVDGLVGRKRFDCIDLIAVINVRADGSSGKDQGIYMTPEAAAAAHSAAEWKTERRTLAQNAKIIEPAPPTRSPGMAADCFVAIREDEAPAVADAIAKGAKIVATVRSGLPGGDSAPVVETEQSPSVDSIQVISGKDSWRAYVPATKDEDKSTGDESPAEPKK